MSRTDDMDETVKLRLSEKTENYPRKLSENCGEYPEESAGVYDRPAE